MNYLEICYLVSKYFGIFPEIFVIHFWFSFIVVREQTFCDLNLFEFMETSFMAKNMVYFGRCSLCTWKEYAFCNCWMKWSVDVSPGKLLGSVVQITCVFVDLLSRGISVIEERYWNL